MPQFSSRSPIGKEPLLAGASHPGQAHRLSDGSIASYDQSGRNTPTHGMQNSGNGYGMQQTGSFQSFSSATPIAGGGGGAGRFGPTASINSAGGRGAAYAGLGGAGAGAGGAMAGGPHGAGGTAVMDDEDMDDALHTFTAKDRKDLNTPFDITSMRGWANAITLCALLAGVLMLFGGYPIIAFATRNTNQFGANTAGYNLGGVNSTGQYPAIDAPILIDPDTPQSAMKRTGFDGEEWDLVFSDEFNKEGRTFYPGDDPFWEAVDIHYWPTGDFEWYDPSAITTENGHLVIHMTQEPINDLNFKSGMLQSWNKLCFNRNAFYEVSVSLPGDSAIGGFWPAFWTMGNLGRAGYGGTNDGLWPYSYDTCDVGTLPNQTWPNGTSPVAALTTGAGNSDLSYLPGQRYSACTCEGEDHPGPNNKVGRAAPEIDVIEAQIIIDLQVGEVSQSFQVAPYDDYYQFNNASIYADVEDFSISRFNSYKGGFYQQAVSVLTQTPRRIYQTQTVGGVSGEFGTFELEWFADFNDRSNGHITWGVDGKRAWTMHADAVAPNPRTQVGRRIVAEEPMYMIFNFAMSNNFQLVQFADLTFPNQYLVDYVRVYQRGDGHVGCDPEDRPTKDFIDRNAAVYNNANISYFGQTGLTWPKNSLVDGCT